MTDAQEIAQTVTPLDPREIAQAAAAAMDEPLDAQQLAFVAAALEAHALAEGR